VFKSSGGTWPQQAELGAAAAVGDNFGYSVAVSGPTTAVGAPYKGRYRRGVCVQQRLSGTKAGPGRPARTASRP
jgi:hypothetical protein